MKKFIAQFFGKKSPAARNGKAAESFDPKSGRSPLLSAHRTKGFLSDPRSPWQVRRVAGKSVGWWQRLLRWLPGRRNRSSTQALFRNPNQLELILERKIGRGKTSDHDFGNGLSTRVRRSDAAAEKSKVIYETKLAPPTAAARMMEESDRAYARLRGRKLENLKLTED